MCLVLLQWCGQLAACVVAIVVTGSVAVVVTGDETEVDTAGTITDIYIICMTLCVIS